MCRSDDCAQVSIFRCVLDCPLSYIDVRGNYADAMDLAKAAGYSPIMAFDERDPAWKAMGLSPADSETSAGDGKPNHKAFFENMLEVCQDAFIPGKGVASGADLTDRMSEVIRSHVAADADFKMYFAFSLDGFWANDFGFSNYIGDATFFCDPSSFDEFAMANDVSVVGLKLADLDLDLFPLHETIIDCAKSAIDRGKELGVAISEENAAVVLREELHRWDEHFELDRVPKEFDAVLIKAVMGEIERQAVRPAHSEVGG
jgi:hypothetical protein